MNGELKQGQTTQRTEANIFARFLKRCQKNEDAVKFCTANVFFKNVLLRAIEIFFHFEYQSSCCVTFFYFQILTIINISYKISCTSD